MAISEEMRKRVASAPPKPGRPPRPPAAEPARDLQPPPGATTFAEAAGLSPAVSFEDDSGEGMPAFTRSDSEGYPNYPEMAGPPGVGIPIPPQPAPAAVPPAPPEPPKICVHCGLPPAEKSGEEPTELEKVQFQHCMLSDEFAPFEKDYTALGGSLLFRFRSLSMAQFRAISARSIAEYNEGRLKSTVDVLMRDQDLWLGATVARISKRDAGGWKDVYSADASPEDPDDGFKKVVAALKGQASLVEVAFRLRRKFGAFVERLELGITDENFYGPAGSDT